MGAGCRRRKSHAACEPAGPIALQPCLLPYRSSNKAVRRLAVWLCIFSSHLPVFLSARLRIARDTGCLLATSLVEMANPCVEYPTLCICPPGWYCPNNTNTTLIPNKPPSPQCLLMRLREEFCPPQHPYEPIPCPFGKYCPSHTEMYDCPEGSWCPLGTANPRKCDAGLSFCPQGAEYDRNFIGVVVILVFIAGFYGWIRVTRWRSARDARRKLAKTYLHEDVRQAMTRMSYFFGQAQSMKRVTSTTTADEESTGLLDVHDGRINGPTTPMTPGPSLAASSEPSSLDGPATFIDIDFENIGLKLPTGQTLLKGVTGRLVHGRLSAILGPSGAGKTTLLSLLAGKIAKTSGIVRVNGKIDELPRYRKLFGFVPQSDIMLPAVTVREAIAFSAKNRLPVGSLSAAEIADHVNNCLIALGLMEVKDTVTGDDTRKTISGGQRKRTNIGIELAAAPLVLFLDEPTSGLDASAAMDVMHALKTICSMGFTIVCVIHQPRHDIFELFDDILVLAQGGRTAYLGPRAGLVTYIEDIGFQRPEWTTPADLIMDILSGRVEHPSNPETFRSDRMADVWLRYVAEVQEHYDIMGSSGEKMLPRDRRLSQSQSTKRSSGAAATGVTASLEAVHMAILNNLRPVDGMSSSGTPYPSISKNRPSAGLVQQFGNCLVRSIVQQWRDLGSLTLELFLAAVAGGLIGLAYLRADGVGFYQGILLQYPFLSPCTNDFSIPLLGVLTTMSVGVTVVPAAVKVFGEERLVYFREASSGHNRLAYFMARWISVVPRLFLCSFFYTGVWFAMVAPPSPFLQFLALSFLLFYCGSGLSYLVSMINRRENAALTGVVMALLYSICCGFGPSLNKVDSWHMTWFWDVSYPRWAAEALYSLFVKPYDHIFDINISANGWGYTLDRVAFDFGMMAIIGTVFRFLAYFAMIGLNRDKQK